MKRFIKFFVTLDTHLIFEKDLTIKSTSDFTPKIDVEFSVASTEDLRNFLGVSGGPISDEELATAKERLNRGDICFIGVHDGMIVNYAWTSFTNAELLDSIFSPPSGVAYLSTPSWLGARFITQIRKRTGITVKSDKSLTPC